MDTSRSEAFASGAQSVKTPQQQTISPIQFQARSVMTPNAQSANALAQPDYQRRLMGLHNSPNSQSEQTFDASNRLRYPFLTTF